jgi:hypothetical protein
MATVVTSIGSNSSIDTETPSSCSGSFSPYTVTFATTPTGVNIGDKVEIVDESSYYSTFTYRVTGISGTSYTLAYITDSGSWGDTSPCDLMDMSFSQAPATFKRFYTSMSNWEAGLDDTSVYSSSDIAVGECHNDSVFNERVTINGGTTVNLASVKLTVHSDSRHTGTAGTGARIIPTGATKHNIIDIARDDVTVEWLEVSGELSSAGGADRGVRAGAGGAVSRDNIYIRNNLIHDMQASTYGTTGIQVFGIGTNIFITNNFIYNITRTNAGSHGIHTSGGSGSEIYCNTLFNISSTSGDAQGIYVGSSAEIVKDNIALSVSGTTASKCFSIGTGSANAASDYNLSDDLTAWGSNSVTSSDGATAANTIADTTSGSEDLHLKSGSYAIGAGVDLGTTPTGVEIDIDGRNRDTEGDTWDIGADQSVGLSVSITPAAAAFELAAVSPSVAQSSLIITVAVAVLVLAGVNPAILYGSTTASPTAAAFELPAITPTIILGSLTSSPAAAAFELAGVSPSVSLGDIAITVAVADFVLAGVSPSVLSGGVTASPPAAAFELAGITPTTVLGSQSITPSVAAFEIAGVSPSIATGSVTASPAVAAFELAGVSPSVTTGSVTASPAAATFELAAVSPSVGIPVLLTPAVASFEIAGITPTAVAGSLSITPAVAAVEFAGVSPSLQLSSVSITPAVAAFELAGVSPSVVISSQTITPTVAAIEFAGISPSVTYSSVSVTPAAAVTNYIATYGSIIAGGITVIPVSPAQFEYTAVDPAVGLSSQTIAVAAAAFELFGISPSVIVANIVIYPAVSVVEFAASVATIHAGVEVTPAAAAFEYVVGSFALIVTMDSASLGYSCDGVLDYIGGVLPTDYNIEKGLDYKYDHQS